MDGEGAAVLVLNQSCQQSVLTHERLPTDVAANENESERKNNVGLKNSTSYAYV
jgi:hypothetical protein